MIKLDNKKEEICNWCIAAMLFFIPFLTMLLTYVMASH